MLVISEKRRPAWRAAVLLLVLFALLGMVGPAWLMAAATAVVEN